MKRIILGCALCCTIISFGQEQLTTIFCNQNQNVAFIMRAPIEQALTGSENFIFSYNQTIPDSLGLLQGKPGLDSNLLIRTADGGLYSYILKYKDTLSRFNYFVSANEQINPQNDKPSKENKVIVKNLNSRGEKNDVYFEKHSKYYLNTSLDRLKIERKHGLKLEVRSINHYRDHVFVVYAIENNSKIDFEINSLELNKVQGKKSRKSSFQKVALPVKYTQDFPEIVGSGSRVRFVMVYPKFTVGGHEKLQLELTELHGSRYLKLLVANRSIISGH